jgi:hypothetical protein
VDRSRAPSPVSDGERRRVPDCNVGNQKNALTIERLAAESAMAVGQETRHGRPARRPSAPRVWAHEPYPDLRLSNPSLQRAYPGSLAA